MRFLIAVCLLFLLWVPLSIIGYGALAGVTGLAIIAPLIVLQAGLLRWLQSIGKSRPDPPA